MPIYKTEKEADDAVKQMTREMLSKYCPVIKDPCLSMCQCYREAQVHNVQVDGRCSASGPYCENPMVCGYMVVNVE